jgi:hypothetical protein
MHGLTVTHERTIVIAEFRTGWFDLRWPGPKELGSPYLPVTVAFL